VTHYDPRSGFPYYNTTTLFFHREVTTYQPQADDDLDSSMDWALWNGRHPYPVFVIFLPTMSLFVNEGIINRGTNRLIEKSRSCTIVNRAFCFVNDSVTSSCTIFPVFKSMVRHQMSIFVCKYKHKAKKGFVVP
jgi:hypothetical protein